MLILIFFTSLYTVLFAGAATCRPGRSPGCTVRRWGHGHRGGHPVWKRPHWTSWCLVGGQPPTRHPMGAGIPWCLHGKTKNSVVRNVIDSRVCCIVVDKSVCDRVQLFALISFSLISEPWLTYWAVICMINRWQADDWWVRGVVKKGHFGWLLKILLISLLFSYW